MTTIDPTAIVTVPSSFAAHRGKHWAKHVTSVDTSRSNGYAFVGTWVRMDQRSELPVGAHVLTYDEETSRELTVRCEPWERALIEAQRAARAEVCPVCQGLGFLGDAGATALSTVPPRHDSELAVRADWWTDQHPGQAAQEVRPYRYDATTQQVRAAFAARRREHPGELASEAQRALADHLGLTPRTVKRRLARGRYAAHGDRPLREVLDAELTDG